MKHPFSALVLAADRHSHDPVAEAAGVLCKALAKIDGTPMLSRVVAALQSSREIGPITLCGPPREALVQLPELYDQVNAGELLWVAPKTSPSASVEAALKTIEDQFPVLVTTADHALLGEHIVTDFAAQARRSGYDAVVALVDYDDVKLAYPELRKTVLKFRDGAYCGCNLFAFLTPRGRHAATFWQAVERQRKQPARIIGAIGWLAVVQYLLGQLSLDKALAGLSARMGLRVGAIHLPYPEAAVDVDSAADWLQIQAIVARAGE